MTARTRKLAHFFSFFLLALLGSSALASEFYFGVSADAAFVIEGEAVLPGIAVVSPGVQLGVKNLLGPFGLRATTEYSVYPVPGLLEGALDMTFDLGTVIDPYAGIGIGVATLDGGSAGMGRVFAGLAPRLNASTGLFAEAMINAYADSSGEAYTLKVRGGVNLFF